MADLIRNLGRIPLAISQAAAYINRAAPQHFWENDKKKGNLVNRDDGGLHRDEGASNAVVTGRQTSFERIRKERPSVADLLSLMSFFNPQGIPESVLRGHLTQRGDGGKGDDEDLDTLRAYSLVTATAERDLTVEREVYNADGKRISQRRFSELDKVPGAASVQLLSNATWYMWTKGLYEKAEIMAISAIKTRERYQGKYKTAEEMNRRALEGREKTLGKEHPDMLNSVYCIDLLFHKQHQYEAASSLYERASSRYQRVLGPEHPTTIVCLRHYSSLVQET
ncbi:hypothetical protein CC78DRAFT_578705 [Lojkania enalia]|uniref:Uncharacterized protein n=1 Tax=Lojkania enalia TaxID=147567 RepID=A0A9P4KBC5_9PLEO|nr:hypothetical protein CC78DRAFT_578705 [Didymosphaeria enalia]